MELIDNREDGGKQLFEAFHSRKRDWLLATYKDKAWSEGLIESEREYYRKAWDKVVLPYVRAIAILASDIMSLKSMQEED